MTMTTHSKRSVSAQRRYRKTRLIKEDDLSARSDDKQVLIARRTMNIGGKRYACGSILPAKEISQKVLHSLIDGRGAAWETKGKRFYPPPTPLAKADKPKPQPVPHIVEDADYVESWLLTEAATIRVCDGNHMLANDVLMGDRACRELYRQATFEAARRVAKIFRKPSIDPVLAWQFIKSGRKKAA
jgi:hypothetical protein